MHHFIFTKADTLITNDPNLYLKNFGGDNELGVSAKVVGRFIYETHTSSYVSSNITTGTTGYPCEIPNYNGYFIGDISGSAYFITGSVIGEGNNV